MIAAQVLRAGVLRLAEAGIADAARDARILLADAMVIGPDRLTLHLPDDLTAAARTRFDAHVSARCTHQPVAQIIGYRLFWGRRFTVTPDTLDPRPETEVLVAEALSRPFAKMLDLGTGTGCILLSCLADMPAAQGVGSDVSAAALAVAQANAAALGLGPRARFVLSDWLSAIDGQFDLIVSNPPYIAAVEMAGLARDVLQWEPHLALTPDPADPGNDGLQAYRIIAAGADARLLPGGRLVLEIGPTQGAVVAAMVQAQGFDHVRVIRDLDGRDRVIAATKPADLRSDLSQHTADISPTPDSAC